MSEFSLILQNVKEGLNLDCKKIINNINDIAKKYDNNFILTNGKGVEVFCKLKDIKKKGNNYFVNGVDLNNKKINNINLCSGEFILETD